MSPRASGDARNATGGVNNAIEIDSSSSEESYEFLPVTDLDFQRAQTNVKEFAEKWLDGKMKFNAAPNEANYIAYTEFDGPLTKNIGIVKRYKGQLPKKRWVRRIIKDHKKHNRVFRVLSKEEYKEAKDKVKKEIEAKNSFGGLLNKVEGDHKKSVVERMQKAKAKIESLQECIDRYDDYWGKNP